MIRKYIGAHFSIAKGFAEMVRQMPAFGANACALFVSAPRSRAVKEATPEEIKLFCKACAEIALDPRKHVLAHASYLINLATPDSVKREASLAHALREAKKCEQLGIGNYNLHPGSSTGLCSKRQSIAHIAASLNTLISQTSSVTFVLETMAGQGHCIGGRFEELRDIIAQIENKTRVGVCIDTCHVFCAGYGLKSEASYEKTMKSFEEIVGFEYLRGAHLNDSKNAFDTHKDHHEEIGKGFLGEKPFSFLMHDRRFAGVPLVLETPDVSKYADEIRLLRSFEE